MSLSKENKIGVVSMIRDGASVKEISDKLNISISLIYDFLKMTIPNDKIIEFDKLRASTQIRILIMSEDYEGALEICNRKENLNNMNIQEQQVRILLKMFQQTEDNILLERALVICDNNPNMKHCKKYKNRINNYKNGYVINHKLTNLFSNICYGNISVEEINNSDIDAFSKSILLISYYEKYNKQKGLEYIKRLKRECDESEKLKILNLLYERLNSKKIKIFDAIIYANYLNCTVDMDMVKSEVIPEVEKVVIKSEPRVIEKKPEIRKKSIYKPKQEITVTNSRYNRYNNPNSCNNGNCGGHKEFVIINKKIKDVFPKEVLVIGTYIYVEMNSIDNQRRAIKAWDNFECLIEKSSDDTSAMNRMITIIAKFRSAGLLDSNELVAEDKKSKQKTK